MLNDNNRIPLCGPRASWFYILVSYHEKSEASIVTRYSTTRRSRYSAGQLRVKAIYLNGSFARVLRPKAQPIRNITGQSAGVLLRPRALILLYLPGRHYPLVASCRPRAVVSPTRLYTSRGPRIHIGSQDPPEKGRGKEESERGMADGKGAKQIGEAERSRTKERFFSLLFYLRSLASLCPVSRFYSMSTRARLSVAPGDDRMSAIA